MSSLNRNVSATEEANNKLPSKRNKSSLFGSRQYIRAWITGLIASIGTLMIGTTIGYPSLAIDDINSHPNPFHVNQDQYSWFASIGCISCTLGCLLCSWIMNNLGHKLTFMLGSIPAVIGWVVIVGAQNMPMMYIGTLIVGLGNGIVGPVAAVYISETATPQRRGLLVTVQEMSLNVGILFSYVIGNFVPWNWFAIACASWPCILVVTTAFILPESPRWLLYKECREEAIEALVYLRCVQETDVGLTTEVKAIQQGLRSVTEVVPWKNYFRPPLLKYFALSIALFMFHVYVTGISVIRIYTVNIFNETDGGHLSSGFQTVIVGVLMVIGTIICALIVNLIERKTLLVLSATIMCIGMTALGTYFKILDIDSDFAKTNLSSWLPLVSMVMATVGFEIGCGPLPHILTSEWFSTQARVRANGAGCIALAISAFLQTKFFPNISQALGLAGTFWLFALICLLEVIVGFLMVPKTRNKTLENIQQDIGQ